MSVQSEITRISSAKTAIASAIAGKGVTVPNGTPLDGMAALIESIEASGGGSSSGYQVATGSVTATAKKGSGVKISVSGFGFSPKAAIIMTTYVYASSSNDQYIIGAKRFESNTTTLSTNVRVSTSKSTLSLSQSSMDVIMTLDDDGFTIENQNSTMYMAGGTWYYMAYG